MKNARRTWISLGLIVSTASCGAWAMDFVLDGKPAATIVIAAPSAPDAPARPGGPRPKAASRGGSPWSDRQAAEVLVDWVRKMTGAELPIAERAPRQGPAIYVGAAAVRAGLTLDAIDSPSREGLRILGNGQRLLVAGQSETATVKAVCRLLEHLGCRYFMDDALGEVYPKTKTLRIGEIDITEKPGFLYRSIWGSEWGGRSLWKVWNGAGGLDLAMGHAWGQYVPQSLFEQHPEYFHLRAGKREPSDWYCTSNPELRRVFADGVIARIRAGTRHPSISPPDGRGYCQCEACQRQDDPSRLEPSTGQVCITNRYVDFYQEVARRVGQQCPESILSFYCYADYTQAPGGSPRLEPNLCAWIAPIRYCRFHSIGQPDCPSRRQLAELIDQWGAVTQRIAYRTYNYNLAECLVPFSMLSVWKHDIPYLKQKGCVGVNLETLTNWQIYGPHIYQSIRLAYDPAADADAVMDDYFQRFYGPKAGPILKEYWMAIDRAFVELGSHAGSYYAVHLVYTPEFLARCRGLLDRATAAAADDPTYTARVRMAAEGLRNAAQYVVLREAISRGDFPAAKKVYEELVSRNEAHVRTGQGNQYTIGYLERFVGPQIAAGAAATAPPNRVLAVLPDVWRMEYDPSQTGLEQGFAKPDFDDAAWRQVATFGRPLDAQGMADRQTVMWYRTRFRIGDAKQKLSLLLVEVDGDATVYVNGQDVGRSAKKRAPFEVDLSGRAVQGDNLVAVRVDHSKITELFLGGILRPVVLIEKER